MTKKNFFLRNVAAIVACLAVTVMFSGCDPTDDPVNPDNPNNPPVGELTELTSPITQNTTLKDLGLPIDYVYKGDNLLRVENNAVLTIEPGVTIQFTKTNGGIIIEDGANIKALGTDEKHIQFIGGTTKGSWKHISVRTSTDNQFTYVDFINGGKEYGVIYFYGEGRAGFNHCKISGSKNNGIYIADNSGGSEIFEFSNNVIEGCDEMPARLWYVENAEHFDATSNLTNNAKNYVWTHSLKNSKNHTVKETTVPYYVYSTFIPDKTFTVEAGVTFYFKAGVYVSLSYEDGVLLVNGTAAKPVTFTREPGTATYWGGIKIWRTNGHIFNNAIIEYGGGASEPNGYNLYVGDSDGWGCTLNDVVIRNSKHYGVWYQGSYGTPVITHNGNVTFSNNADGNVRCIDGTVVNTLP